MTPVPGIYSQPRKPHEWWRGTLPTVPSSAGWEEVIARVERVGEGVSLVVLDGTGSQDLYLPAPDHAVFGIQVCLEGAIALTQGCGRAWQLHGGMALVFNHGSPAPALWHLPAGRQLRLVDIRLTPGALGRLGWECLPRLLRDRLAAQGGLPETALTVAFAAPPAYAELAWALAGTPPVSDPMALQGWRTARILEALALVADVLAAPRVAGGTAGREHAAVLLAATLLRNDCARAWTPAQLARKAGISEKKLQAGFQRCFGASVHAYLRDLRLRQAADMLERGYSVTQAAADSGFSSQSHFGKVFRVRYGLGPREWGRRALTVG